MWKSSKPPLSRAAVKARIVRYLIRKGGAKDTGQIRYFAGGLANVGTEELWQALRELVDSGQILFSYSMHVEERYGFKLTDTCPVFWVIANSRIGGGE